MSQSAITVPDACGILRTTASGNVESTGPLPIWLHVDRELKRIAHVWGTQEKGWTCRYDATGCVLSAYVGRPSCIVAVAHHVDSREGLKRLLASLFEVDGT